MANPPPSFGSSLLAKSKANPGSIDMSIFQAKSKPVGQGAVSSNYLQKTREDNPEPEDKQKTGAGPALSNCRFVTPVEDLRAQEEFEMAVDVKIPSGSTSTAQATFTLFCYVPKDGKEERSKTWTVEGKVDGSGPDSIVVKARRTLMPELGTTPGEKTGFELEATHPDLKEPCKSPRIDVVLKTMAHWAGGDDLHFRTDGEFPLLGADGGLLQVLATAVGRIQKPQQEGETIICFGFASSASDPDRELSRRRAQVVKALLDRDESSWSTLAKANFETVDIQQFLSDLHAACAWECDPGAVDGQDGPQTKAAIQSFQAECNSRYQLGLKEDGLCGPKTWGAVQRAILGQVQDVLGDDSSKPPSWPKPNWGNGGEGVYANGEDFATGGDKPEERSVQITFLVPGAEQPLKKPAGGQKLTEKENPHQDEKLVEKKKIDKSGDVSGSNPVQDELFSITSDQVGILTGEGIKVFEREAKRCEKVSKILGPYFHPDSPADKTRAGDLQRAAYLEAALGFLSRFCEETDEKKSDELAKSAAESIEEDKKKIEKDESFAERVLVKGSGMEAGWVQKVYSTRGKRALWVRPGAVGSHVRWMTKKQALKAIQKDYKNSAEEDKEKATGKTPARINELNFYELFDSKKGTFAPGVEKYFEEIGLKEYLVEDRHLQGGASIQALRYSLEGKIGSNINWKKEREVKIEAKVEGSLSLIAGQGHFDIYLPNKEGFDLIAAVQGMAPGLFKAGTKPMPFQIQLKMAGNAFVGACASASGGLGISLKAKKEGGVECGLEAFAGAKVGAEAGIAIRVKLWNDKGEGKFEDLSEVTYGAWGAVGIGAEFVFKLGYYEGKYRFQMRAGVVLKAGAGQYLKASVNANKVATMIWTLGCAVRWDRMHDILSDAIWDLYQALMYHALALGGTIESAGLELVKEFEGAASSVSHEAEVGLGQLKTVDDTFDKYVPGYSGFKQFHPTFLLLRSTYHYLKEVNHAEDLKQNAIRLVRQTERTNRWMYMTPEVKENLIVELAYGGSGIRGTDEDKEECIILILRSLRTKREFHQILDRLKDRRGVELEHAVDGEELDELKGMKVMHAYTR